MMGEIGKGKAINMVASKGNHLSKDSEFRRMKENSSSNVFLCAEKKLVFLFPDLKVGATNRQLLRS
jgi:hypothetical protein